MPPLASILNPSYLASLRSHPGLPRHTWYFIAGVTLSTLNRPDEIGTVFKYALERGVHPEDDGPIRDEAEKLKIARRMREALVKSSAIIGLPKVSQRPHHPYRTVIPRNSSPSPNRPSTP